MEKHVLIVMAGRIQAEHLDVEGVRDPGQRMPVGGIAVEKRPGYRAQGQAVLDVRVLGYVLGVIEVGEGMLVYRRINGEGNEGEQKAKGSRAQGRIGAKKIAARSSWRLRLNVDGSHRFPFSRRVYPIGSGGRQCFACGGGY